MARLRIRVELNRGGVGIPLHKLSSVVQEAEKFFEMLAEDVRIDKDGGEWLAFDFDNESLNFTAEYVGPASVDQVQAFAAAFDGTTSLRRATIAQFTHITDAIGEDELIGFGLYHSDHEVEPSEWRCLSRRDALRIADEIQVLLGASGELEQTHLPAVTDTAMGTRMFKERHERGALTAEQSKWPILVREVEANLSKRLSRLEGQVEDHSRSIHDLRDASGAAEESFRNLLTSVENFCSQATRQLERITPVHPAPEISAPAQLAGPARADEPAAAPVPSDAVVEEPLVAELAAEVAPIPAVVQAADVSEATVPEEAPAAAPIPSAPAPVPAPAPILFAGPGPKPTGSTTGSNTPIFAPPPAPRVSSGRGWKAYLIAAVLIIGVVSTVVLLLSPKSDEPSEQKVSAASVTPPPEARPVPSPAATVPESSLPKPAVHGAMRVEIEAREPAWVTVTDASGRRLLAKTLEANETHSMELTAGATLRTGNAGGLIVRFNGKEIGPLGPTGKIRDISFKDGGYKVHAPDAG